MSLRERFYPGEFFTIGLHRFEIAYVAESYYGDRLDFFVSEEAADATKTTYNVEIKKNGTEVVCRAKAVFD